MRLIRAHVENFGKLQHYDMNFADGLNTILHDNGWGKSTLAAFIRVMLFGFENTRKRTEVENEMRRFTPWQGGVYGGYIIFEANGKTYRLVRRFDNKKSYFELYDNETNLKSDDFSENIGEELFGIDSQSFTRTIFIAQQTCSTEATSGISAKIADLNDETADLARFDAADAMLKKECDRLTPDRVTGLLSKLNSSAADLRALASNQPNVEKKISDLKASLLNTQAEINEALRGKDEVSRQRDDISRFHIYEKDMQRYRYLSQEAQRAKEQYEELRSFFGEEIPDENIVSQAKEAAGRIAFEEEESERNRLSDKEKTQLEELRKQFAEHVPDEMELNDIRKDIATLSEIHEKMAITRLSDAEAERLAALEVSVPENHPANTQVDAMIEKWRTREKLLQENTIAADFAKVKLFSALVIILGVAGMIIGGALFYMYRDNYVMLAVCGIGVLVLIFGFCMRNRSAGHTKVDNDAMARQIEEDVCALFNQANVTYSQDQALSKMYAMKNDFAAYDDLKTRDKMYRAHDYERREDQLESGLRFFMNNYGLKGDDYYDMYCDIIQRIRDFHILSERSERFAKAEEGLTADLMRLDDFFSLVGNEKEEDVAGQLAQFQEKAMLLPQKEAEMNRRQQQLDEFLETVDIESLEKIDCPQGDESELTEKIRIYEDQIEDLRNKLFTYNDQIEELREQQNEIIDACADLEEREAEIAEAQHRYDVVKNARAYLQEAKAAFLRHYMDSMQKAFDRYYTMLTGDKTDVYDLDASLNVTIRTNGQNRDILFLSEGYQDLIGMCRRMAMIDAMKKKKKPFLILDDPFVNLDDEKVERGLKFLEAISRQYQVIYFTCSQSRRA